MKVCFRFYLNSESVKLWVLYGLFSKIQYRLFRLTGSKMIQLKSYCKFLVLIILNFNLVRLQYYSNQNPKASITRRPNYFLRWVLNDPILPIYIEKPTTKEADYKWFKYPQERFIDEIENYETNYLYSQKVDKTILYIVEYNNKSHEQLGTYEPVAIGLRTDEYDVVDAKSYEPADLYTLVYLESHFIDRVVDVYDSNKINFFCNISLLMPNNKMHELNQANLKLIERSVNLKMGFFNNYHHGKEEIKHSDVSVADNGKHKHMGKSMRVMISVLKHNINNLTRLKRSSKNFNSNSFIQVNICAFI